MRLQNGPMPLAVTATMAAVFGAIAAATAMLWIAYGDRVYFDAIMNGLASCFS